MKINHNQSPSEKEIPLNDPINTHSEDPDEIQNFTEEMELHEVPSAYAGIEKAP